MMSSVAIIVVLLPFTVFAQERAEAGKSEVVTSEPVPAARAQELLRALVPEKSKSVTLNTYVAGTNVQDINLGMHCTSNSNGSTTGTVDDNGNINARTTTNGGTTCRERHIYKRTMYLGFEDAADPNASYLMTVQCQQKWVWDHCDMPPEHAVYPVVIKAEKHGTFSVFAATSKQLGGKTKVAKFSVLDLSHVMKKANN
jgi:hypothetical protein